jgi:hypothetical protein
VMGVLGEKDPGKADMGLIGKRVRLNPHPGDDLLESGEVQVPEFSLIAD